MNATTFGPVLVRQRREDQRFLHEQVAAIGARRQIGIRIDDAAARKCDRQVLTDDAHVVRFERQRLAIRRPTRLRPRRDRSTRGVEHRAERSRALPCRRS